MLLSFSGKLGSGKDAAAEYLVKQYGFQRLAFADTLKQAVLTLDPFVDTGEDGQMRLSSFVRNTEDWNWAKREILEIRRLLQIFGTEVGRDLLGPNVWVNIVEKKMLEYIAQGQTNFVLSDTRFGNEIDFIKKYGGKSALIIRPSVNEGTGHISEQLDFKTDWLIRNDGTLDEFYLWVEHFYQMTRGGNV